MLLGALLAAFLLARPAAPVQAGALAQFRATLTPTLQPISLRAPLAGEVLQGSVSIVVDTDVPGFRSAELSFAYSGDPTGVWFLIAESNSPVREAGMTTWDTSMITDGEYDLRLVVTYDDRDRSEVIVPGLRVRNYSAVETGTPAPSPTLDPGLPTRTLTATASPPAPTPTPLPTNPAIPGPGRTQTSLGLGIGLTVALFGALGFYLARRTARRH